MSPSKETSRLREENEQLRKKLEDAIRDRNEAMRDSLAAETRRDSAEKRANDAYREIRRLKSREKRDNRKEGVKDRKLGVLRRTLFDIALLLHDQRLDAITAKVFNKAWSGLALPPTENNEQVHQILVGWAHAHDKDHLLAREPNTLEPDSFRIRVRRSA